MRDALVSADSMGHPGSGREPLAISRFERMLDRNEDVRSETAVNGRRHGTRPFRDHAAPALVREGFLVRDSTGAEFRAPNPAVFLSDAFHAAYCWRVVQGSGINAGMIGLRFEAGGQPEPEANRAVPIGGAFWADAEPFVLRFAEFNYDTPQVRDAPAAGGRLAFERLPSGNWIIRDWFSRAPISTQTGLLLGYREEGGEVLLVPSSMLATIDSIEISRLPAGTVSGVVTDSLTMSPFAGAHVWVDSIGSGWTATTDSAGSFTIPGVRAGAHAVSFSHPLLDSLGIRPLSAIVQVRPNAAATTSLSGPAFRTLVGDVCGDSAAIVAGSVRDAATRAPVDSADVVVSWIGIVFEPGRRLRISPGAISVGTNAAGRFAACVPEQFDVIVHAEKGMARSARLDITTGERRLGTVSIALDLAARDTLAGSSALRGIVMQEDGTPLPNAEVSLTEPELSGLTDAAGRFRLAGLPGGTRVVDVRAIGYAPARRIMDLGPGDTTTMMVFLRKVRQLDPIVVRARAGDPTMQVYAELEERRRKSLGFRLDQVDLVSFRYAPMSSVIRSLPFVRARGRAELVMQSESGSCVPPVWVDGRRWPIIQLMDDLAAFQPTDIIAIEVFTRASEVPIQFQEGGGSVCGAIVIWTKDLRWRSYRD